MGNGQFELISGQNSFVVASTRPIQQEAEKELKKARSEPGGLGVVADNGGFSCCMSRPSCRTRQHTIPHHYLELETELGAVFRIPRGTCIDPPDECHEERDTTCIHGKALATTLFTQLLQQHTGIHAKSGTRLERWVSIAGYRLYAYVPRQGSTP